MEQNPADLSGYQQAQQGAAYFHQTDAGYIEIGGEDRIAFLQRQTTNDLRQVEPGRGVLTVLTSPTARILDVLCVFEHPEKRFITSEEKTLGIITLPGNGERTASYFTGRIFFNDKVQVRNASEKVAQIDLIGPQAAELLKNLGMERLPEKNEIVDAALGSLNILALAPQNQFTLGYRVMVLPELVETAVQALNDAGAVALSPEAYLTLRIEAGQPDAGYELTEDYTPLETGLQTAISDSKGCYTGQEVIARQVTYDKITQSLVGLRLDGPVDPQTTVWVDGKAAGKITSSIISPRFGPISLAVLKRPNNAVGTQVQAGRLNEQTTKGVVTSLPFSE